MEQIKEPKFKIGQIVKIDRQTYLENVEAEVMTYFQDKDFFGDLRYFYVLKLLDDNEMYVTYKSNSIKEYK